MNSELPETDASISRLPPAVSDSVEPLGAPQYGSSSLQPRRTVEEDNYDDDGEDDEESDEDDAEDDDDEDDEDDPEVRYERSIVYDFQEGNPNFETFSPYQVLKVPGSPKLETVPTLIDLQAIGHQKVLFHNPETWRVNLAGISRSGYLFVADGEKVKIFKISSTARPELTSFAQLAPPKPNPPTATQFLGANNPMNLFSINAIKIGSLGGEEHLAILTDAGQAIVYSISSIVRDFEKGNAGGMAANSLPIYVLQLERSAWGVDFHDREKLMVVTDNSRTITIFRLGYSGRWESNFEQSYSHRQLRKSQADYYSSSDSCASTASTQTAGTRRRKHRSSGPHTKRAKDSQAFRRVISHAHDNNMPSARFLDVPLRDTKSGVTRTQVCVMTTSIDGDVKIWDISTLRCISNSVFQNKKGWSCLPLFRHEFTPVDSVNVISGVKAQDDLEACLLTGQSRYAKNPNVIITYPVKSRSPYMTVTKRGRRANCNDGEYPYELYEEIVNALFDQEATVDATGRHQHYEDSVEDTVPGYASARARVKATEINPLLSAEERQKYILDDVVVFHSSLYQTRLVEFKNGEQTLANICPAVFGKRVPVENFTASFDRLNMSLLIRELSCVLVASQEGLVGVFKLCQCRETGQIGMKQEYILSEKRRMTSNNTLMGMDVIPVQTDAQDLTRRFLLVLVYINGTVATYQLRRNGMGAIEEVQDIDDLII